MTDIRKVETECYICGTQYTSPVIYSTYSGLPKPNIKAFGCPKCGAPYKPYVNLQVGMAKTILLDVLNSEDKAANTLFDFVRTESELNNWGSYLQDYATENNFKEWKEFNARESIIEDDNKITTLYEMLKKGNLKNIIERVIEMTRNKVKSENQKYLILESINK